MNIYMIFPFQNQTKVMFVVTANDGVGRVGWGEVGGGSFMLGFGAGGGYHIFCIFLSVFVLLLIVLSWLVHDNCACFIFNALISITL